MFSNFIYFDWMFAIKQSILSFGQYLVNNIKNEIYFSVSFILNDFIYHIF